MQPLKIVFTMVSPIIVDNENPFHLDALLAARVCEEAQSLGSDNAWADADDLSAYLERADFEHDWVWKASALQFTPHERMPFVLSQMNMLRRSDPEGVYDALDRGDWESTRKINPKTWKIDTVSGQNRTYQWIAQMRYVSRMTAWCVGDEHAIADALSRVSGIGKMRRNGFGRVGSVSVEAAPAHERDHWMLRVMPHGAAGLPGVAYEPVISALRAPYWRKTRAVVAQEPLI